MINARVENTDDDQFRPIDAPLQQSPRMRSQVPAQQPLLEEDVLSIQDQINKDYENRLKEVNDEA